MHVTEVDFFFGFPAFISPLVLLPLLPPYGGSNYILLCAYLSSPTPGLWFGRNDPQSQLQAWSQSVED